MEKTPYYSPIAADRRRTNRLITGLVGGALLLGGIFYGCKHMPNYFGKTSPANIENSIVIYMNDSQGNIISIQDNDLGACPSNDVPISSGSYNPGKSNSKKQTPPTQKKSVLTSVDDCVVGVEIRNNPTLIDGLKKKYSGNN